MIEVGRKEKEALLLAFGCFGERKAKSEMEWHEDVYGFKFDYSSEEISRKVCEIYNTLFKELEGDK